MNQKLDSYLVEKYPKIFINRYVHPSTSCMSFGFEHGDGWFFIIDQLCYSIQTYLDNNNKCQSEGNQIPQVVATQVKEKFGTLNFYYYGGSSIVDGMVHMAENMSSNMCEFCGSTENVGHTTGWISIICEDCYNIANDNIKNRIWTKNSFASSSDITSELRKIKLDKLNNG